MSDIFTQSLSYHKNGKKGKIEITTTKPLNTQEDLSLAYSPGVAGPCLEIQKNISKIYDYTCKGNMVLVVSDGSAVLGLGDIGPYAALPVMEGKCALLKKFADIDSFPICLDIPRLKNGLIDIEKVVSTIASISPSFGGIILEDIKAPECFEIETKLDAMLDIPVFHDDQHGTAIISLAGLLNGLLISGKKIDEIKVVINGAGAAGIATARFYINAGVKKDNLILCDSLGIIYQDRKDGMNKYKEEFAIRKNIASGKLQDALRGADVFVGVSKGNILNANDVKQMAKDPIIFAMANPIAEIMPDIAIEAGALIVGTGRSDFPNQINNVLGFPGIFRGALDARAKKITIEMKIASSKALADLAKKPVTGKILEVLKKAYPKDFKDGIFNGTTPLKKEYVIPKPFDPRVVKEVARAVKDATK